MRILPVLDLLGGVVVRGVAGRRHEYKPLVSPLCRSAEPILVATALHDHFHLSEFYVADLDAIGGGAPWLAVYRELQGNGFRLWVDAGLRQEADAVPLADAGVDRLVAGLETLAGPDVLTTLCYNLGPERIVFSLDLKEGQALGNASAWGSEDSWNIATKAVAAGVRGVIVLDLARVGVGSGTGTDDLCRRLSRTYPELELTAGGGVRGLEDLQRLKAAGVQNVLVSSALHSGALDPNDLSFRAFLDDR